jgi:hypothetical protein
MSALLGVRVLVLERSALRGRSAREALERAGVRIVVAATASAGGGVRAGALYAGARR